jgi:heterodisulfide reductase subunit B
MTQLPSKSRNRCTISKWSPTTDAYGATPLDWSYKTECCGGSLSLTRTELALQLTRKILENALAVGADVVTTACPLCHVNLDARQAALKLEKPIPILFITQLMGLAYDIEPHALALEKNMVDTRGLIDRVQKTPAKT